MSTEYPKQTGNYPHLRPGAKHAGERTAPGCDDIQERLFLTAYVLWLSAAVLKLTMWNYITPAAKVFSRIQLIAYLLLVVQFFTKLLSRLPSKRGAVNERNIVRLNTACLSRADVLGVILIFFSAVLAWRSQYNRQILPVMLFLYFSADISYKKILKCTVAVQLAVMAAAAAASGCGLIEDILWYEGDRVRHSLGYDYCGFPAHIMLFVTMAWLCIRGKARCIDAAVLLVLNGILYYFTDSRSDLLLAVIGIAGAFLWGRDFSEESADKTAIRRFVRIFSSFRIFVAKFGFLIAFAVSVVVQYFYNSDNAFWYRINETLNGRLQLGHDAIREYGFSLFGKVIHWYGQGSLRLDDSLVYNYVDNSFVKELLTYGWIFAVLLLIGFYFTGKKLAEQKEWMLCWALLVTVAYSMINAQLCFLAFQPFILLPGMLFASNGSFASDKSFTSDGRTQQSTAEQTPEEQIFAGQTSAEQTSEGQTSEGQMFAGQTSAGKEAVGKSGRKTAQEFGEKTETAPQRMRFLNTEIDNITFEEALAWIELHLDGTAEETLSEKQKCVLEPDTENENAGRGGYIVTPNIDHIVRLETDTEFQKAYQGASLVLTDGQPLIWISKLLGTPIKEKISGSDLFPRVCRLAAEKGYRMYFLGAAPGVADMAAQKLKASCPGLQVVGTCSPEYGFEKDEGRVREIWRDIHQAKPDILIAALGTPKQEIFLWQYQDELQGMLGIGIGAGLDFAAGNVTRAPRWMQKCGLEWFYRLCHEPKRLFKRYLVDDLKILPIVWKYRK